MAEPNPNPPEDALEIAGARVNPGDRLGGYVYRRLVGKGGMAHVVLASDPAGRDVALKVLKASRMATGLGRFKREFRALARLRHPNVIRVESYGDLHGHPFIAMEYVQGIDLHQLIHDFKTYKPKERWRRTEEVLVDLCRALAYIHRRGLIHRDLKPSNVLIDREGRCKLTDFGIVKDLDPASDTLVSTTLVGTWAYASPEQMAGAPIDHRSDLYSLGVILFAMLTGRRPFVAKDLAGYLELHRGHVAPHAKEYAPGVPDYLDEICDRLLRKSPRERFRSAQEILFRLEREDAVPQAENRGAWKPPLVGRELEEGLLRDHISALTAGRGGTVYVRGGEGCGRTRLLDVAEAHAMLIGLFVARGRLEARDGALAAAVRLAGELAAELGPGRTPEELQSAIATFREGGEAPPGNARERLLEGLGLGLAALAEEGPVLVLWDDLHLARIPLLDVVGALQRRLADAPVLFIATLQLDRMTPRLQAFCAGAELPRAPDVITLAPLSESALLELVATLLGEGRPAEALARRLWLETQGNALFATLFLQHLMGQGAMERLKDAPPGAKGAWRLNLDVDEVASGHFEIPPGVRQVVRARLAPLGPMERRVCEVLATHGPHLDVDLLLDVLESGEDEVAEAIESLEEGGIVQTRRSLARSSIEFTQPKYGDVTYRELPVESRALLHRTLAMALERRDPHGGTAAEIVGEHYRRAGDAAKAWLHLVDAAARMRARNVYTEATELAERASALQDAAAADLPPRAFAEGRQRLLLTWIDLHITAGRWPEARDAAEQAVALGPGDDAATLRARIALTRILRAQGAFDAATTEATEALAAARTLGDKEVLCEALRVRAAVAWARGEVEATEVFIRDGLSLAEGGNLASVRAHLLLARGQLQLLRAALPQAIGSFSEAEQIFRDLRHRAFQAVALAFRAHVLLAQGRLGAAWRDGVLGLEMARDVNHRYAETLARCAIGNAALASGHLADAQADLTIADLRSRGLRLASDSAGPCVALARVRLARGDLGGATAGLDQAASALAGGDPERLRATVAALRVRALAQGPDPQRAASAMQALVATLPSLPALRAAEVGVELGFAAWAMGQSAEAWRLAREAAATARARNARMLLLRALEVKVGTAPLGEQRESARQQWLLLHREVGEDVPERWRADFDAHARAIERS